MNYTIRTNKWGVPMLQESPFETYPTETYPTVAEAVRAYVLRRRSDICEALGNIRYDLQALQYTSSTRRRYHNMNLYMNRIQNNYRKIRMANKILEEHNGTNRS